MSFTVFLGNLPTWVTADDIQSWLNAEALVADSIKVIRNPETQESKGFAFIEAPNAEEMQAIIRRFDRAPLEDKLLRANPAQPPKGKTGVPMGRPEDRRPGMGADRRREGAPMGVRTGTTDSRATDTRPAGDRPPATGERPPAGDRTATATAAPADRNRAAKRRGKPGGTSAFAEELAKAL